MECTTKDAENDRRQFVCGSRFMEWYNDLEEHDVVLDGRADM
jgi:hypothetical protein